MNRLEKAAAFGAMMAKRAAEAEEDYISFSHDKYPSPPNIHGGKGNRVGTTPSASTTPRIPYMNSDNPSAPFGRVSELPYSNFLSTNYSDPVDGGFGKSRLNFHKDLTSQLNKLTNPVSPSRSDLLSGKDSYWGKWNNRMGQIASDLSAKAPIPHSTWTGEAFLGRPAHASWFKNLSASDGRTQYAYVPKSYSYPYPFYPGGIQRMEYNPTKYKDSEPRSLDNRNMARVHENTHAGWQDLKLPRIGPRGDVSPKVDVTGSKGLHIGSTSSAPLVSLGRMAALESGAVFNEIGQGARAFKDVAGKPLQGAYQFAPGVEMDYRELGDLAKKYKPTDLNSPAGQLWLRNILKNSNTPAAEVPPGLQPGVPIN